ncbi:MAG: transcriptional repressor [bacterium]
MPKNKKLRTTSQRRVIIEELDKVKSHPAADQVYEMVRKRMPRISLGTVYRNLKILSDSGVIQKLEKGGMQKRFDSTTRNHYHLRCLKCGEIVDVPIKPIVRIEDKIRTLTDYEIIGHCLEFIGICPKCRKKKVNL